MIPHGSTVASRKFVQGLLLLLPGGLTLGNGYIDIRTRAAPRRRVKRKYFPTLFYVLLGLMNIGFLLVFGGTSFRSSALGLWSKLVPGHTESVPAESEDKSMVPDQFPPGENWYSGSEDEQGQPLQGAPPHPK